MNTCEICGRKKVDPMTLNSTGINKNLCYKEETGSDPRCKCKHKNIVISDSIATCLFTATCRDCGKIAGGMKTITKAKAALKKLV